MLTLQSFLNHLNTSEAKFWTKFIEANKIKVEFQAMSNNAPGYPKGKKTWVIADNHTALKSAEQGEHVRKTLRFLAYYFLTRSLKLTINLGDLHPSLTGKIKAIGFNPNSDSDLGATACYYQQVSGLQVERAVAQTLNIQNWC